MAIPTLTNTPDPTQWGYHAALGELLLRLVTTQQEPYTIRREFQQTQTVNTAVNPEDFTDDFGRTYSMVEFTGGEDRRFAHRRRDGQEQDRFWRSEGVFINDDGDIEVVNTMEQITASGGVQTVKTRAAYDAIGDAIYHTNDTADLTKITNLLGAPPTTATEVTGLVGTASDVAVLGSTVYACDGAEIRDNAGGWAQWSNLAATRIWAVKDRIVASTGTALYDDPNGSGPHVAEVTLPAGQSFVDVVDAGAFVLAASESTVFALTFDGSALSLAAQREFPFETITAIASLQGATLVLTHQRGDDGNYTQRLWLGEVGDDGVLVAEVLREWTTDQVTEVASVLAEVERDSIYLTIDDGTDTALWRFNVGFGYLMSDRIIDGLTGQKPTDIIKAQGRFWVFAEDGDVWRETTTKRTQGVIVSPAIDHFTAQKKVWTRTTVNVDFSSGSDEAIIDATSSLSTHTDTPFGTDGWTRVQLQRLSSDPSAVLTLAASRYLALRVTLKGTAVLTGWAVRSLPPSSDEEIVLNVNVSDHVSRPGKAPLISRGHGEEMWQELRKLQGTSIFLNLFDIDQRWRGSIVEVATPVTSTLDTGSVTKVCRVTFRGLVPNETTTILSASTWGSALWGESVLSGGN